LSLQDVLRLRTKIFKHEFLILSLIIICACIIRFWGFVDVGFNNDEAIYSGQAATLAGFEEYGKFFSIFRAHPLLLQFITSILFSTFGISDTLARIVPIVFGVLTIIFVYFIAKMLFDKRVATAAAIVITILPYHIIVSREVLIDVPLSFFFTLTLYFLIRYMKNPSGVHWLYLIGVTSGLSFLSKEVGIFALICSVVSLFFVRRFTIKTVAVVVSSFILVVSPYWIPILTLNEANDAWLTYWQWQTQREANQPDTFYLSLIPNGALGYVLTALVLLAIFSAIITKSIKRPEVFLPLIWISVPLIIFQLLPIKGFHFAMALIPGFTIFGVSFLFGSWMQKIPHYRFVTLLVIPLILISSGAMLNYLFGVPFYDEAGSGGEPYAREAALWVRDYLNDNSTLLTMDTPMANIIKYYSNNEVYSLHANKNPAYTKIANSDLSILNGEIDYLVFEKYRIEKAPYLEEEADELLDLVMKYGGIPIYSEYKTPTSNTKNTTDAAIIIYTLNKSPT
jgi:4-amino-4-deoxy-L-arabinose transferase-like glycosyltransferase